MKPFLRWRDDWLLGLDALDAQHLALAKILNDIHGALDEGEAEPSFNSVAYQGLLALAEMTREHFGDEERIMRAQGYPGLGEHHTEHALLLAELQDLIRHIEEGKRHFTLDTLIALKHWQIDHVLNSDREFAEYYRRLSEAPVRMPSSSQQTASELPHSFR
ncbi:MAG: hemerythrin family protein [Candidatus Thiodiazotropha sp. (ex Notomyrtea botanica)]|nr:hemerythrin family protein [Candidatus Thiodiazotropha sp. (ex Notomyrtea botanica)]